MGIFDKLRGVKQTIDETVKPVAEIVAPGVVEVAEAAEGVKTAAKTEIGKAIKEAKAKMKGETTTEEKPLDKPAKKKSIFDALREKHK